MSSSQATLTLGTLEQAQEMGLLPEEFEKIKEIFNQWNRKNHRDFKVLLSYGEGKNKEAILKKKETLLKADDFD